MPKKNLFLAALIFCLLAPACAPPDPSVPAPYGTATASAVATAEPTASPAASSPSTPSPAPSPTPVPPTTAPTLCSPLAGIPLEQLPAHLTNPFQPPPPGSDDPHQGIDLAVFLPDSRVAIAGNPVLALTSGQVVMVLADRFPYGNAVLMEIPAGAFSWEDEGLYPPPQTPVSPTLTCPGETDLDFESSSPAFYILSAHLQETADLQPGDPVACGQELGQVGDSGNALNPHLHLEIRLGPAGAVFPGMAHYTGSASPAEMDTYCTWRVSGLFKLVNPLRFLGLQEDGR